MKQIFLKHGATWKKEAERAPPKGGAVYCELEELVLVQARTPKPAQWKRDKRGSDVDGPKKKTTRVYRVSTKEILAFSQADTDVGVNVGSQTRKCHKGQFFPGQPEWEHFNSENWQRVKKNWISITGFFCYWMEMFYWVQNAQVIKPS